MPKYLDMPEGNGNSPAYAQFKDQIDRGRAVSVVRVLRDDGEFDCFIGSGEPVIEITEANSLRHAVALTQRTRLRAEKAGHHPVEGYTHELIDASA